MAAAAAVAAVESNGKARECSALTVRRRTEESTPISLRDNRCTRQPQNMAMMRLNRVARASVAHPFGDHRTVQQAFPGGVGEKEADPFLMCDYFNFPGKGPVAHPDDFPVGDPLTRT